MNGDPGNRPPEGTGGQPGDYSAPGLGQTPGVTPGVPQTPPPPVTPQAPGAQQPPQAGVPPMPRYAPPPQAPPQPGIPPTGVPPLPRRAETRPPKGPRRGGIVLTAFVAAIIGALLVLIVMPWAFGVNPWDLVRGKLRTGVTREVPNEVVKVVSPTQGATDVSTIARKITPSIVNIDIRTSAQASPFLPAQVQEGTGSGVIYTTDGYILTNNHVVADAQDITVTFASGQEEKGKKVGADPENDIAVVKVEKTGLPAIEIGDSDSLVVGQLVVAVGSPFGFEQTVTSGIVSALHRVVPATEQSPTGQQQTTILTDLIQTDAAINPGNSGGALCDSEARLIGVNALIASQSGGSEGIGFAIPIDNAKKVADDIIAGRPVSHPYMGVLGQTVTEEIARQYSLPVTKGAYVTRVVPGGPAEKAGIKAGDIVVEIAGQPINSIDDLIAAVRKGSVGEKLSVAFYSGSEKKTVDVTLEEKPANL